MKTKEPAETKTKKMKKAGNNRWWKYLLYMQRRRPTKKWQGFRRWGQSCGCDVVNVRDAISSIVWMRHNPVNYVMIENIVAIRNHGSCPENSVYIQYLPVFTVFTYSIYSIYLIFTYKNFSDQPWQI